MIMWKLFNAFAFFKCCPLHMQKKAMMVSQYIQLDVTENSQ